MFDVDCRLRPSRLFWVIQGLILVVSMAALAVTAIPLGVKGIVALVVMGYVGAIHRSHARFRHLVTDGKVWKLGASNGLVCGTLRGDSTVMAWAIILRLSVPQKTRPVTCVLFFDAVPKTEWRRLRVLACHGGRP